MEEAAKVTEERQVRNWVENNEYIRPESPMKKRGSVHLGQVLLLNQVR